MLKEYLDNVQLSHILEREGGWDSVQDWMDVLSGGEKQRISIARALMKNASILILDDSVSAVDTKTEKNILEALKNLRQGKTTILIAHRITTIEKMDKIIFIDNGHVVSIGSHKELVASCEEYRHMVELQRLDEEEGF